jgi:hypothetical protein
MVYIRSGRALRGTIHLPHLTGKPLKIDENVVASEHNKNGWKPRGSRKRERQQPATHPQKGGK